VTRRTDGPWPVWEILPGQLYQSAKLHGRPVEQKCAGLRHYGVTEVYALAPTKPDPDSERWYSYANGLRDWYCRYTHNPIPDGLLKVDLLPISAELAQHIRDGDTVLTMCNAGRNRSGLLSALIVRELTGLPGAAAMAVVRHHRPNAIANPHFEEFLRGLD
jgi:protein-tyrosine phosphatase